MLNRDNTLRWLAAAMLLLSLPAAAGDLYTLWRDVRGGEYRMPDAAELNQAETLFKRQLEGEADTVLGPAWLDLGFRLTPLQVENKTLWVLHEAAGRQHGRGFYVFNPGAPGRAALQAPHSYRDSYTGQIALALFSRGDFAAAALNSVPRSSQSDVAHLSQSYFNAFSRAYARAHGRGRVIQLHGFAQEKRRGAAARSADVILSAASRWPSAAVFDIDACLSPLLPKTVRIYPRDVTELGALRNANAAMLRAQGFDGFVHVEMSKPLRRRLRDDAGLRDRFSGCLQARTL